MTFEEAYDALNAGGIDAVANEMKEWHPSTKLASKDTGAITLTMTGF